MNKQNQIPDPAHEAILMIHRIESVALVELTFNTTHMRSKLESQGFPISFELTSCDGLLTHSQRCQPDALLVMVDQLGERTLNQLADLYRVFPMPILVFAHRHAPEALKATVASGICAYVVDDVRADRLPVIIDLAIERFEQSRCISSELEQTKKKLDNRKLIEKAKGILMQEKQIAEDVAYSQMRRSAMNQGITMAELSQRIINLF